MCLLGVEYLIFTFLPIFHQKIVKIKSKIGNFKPKWWNMKYTIFQKLRNRTQWKFNTKLGTWNAVFGCNMMTSWQIQDGGRTPYWKSFFGYISVPYLPINAKFGTEMTQADIGHFTKTAIFANSRWRMAAILKIALYPYLIRELTDFDQIW